MSSSDITNQPTNTTNLQSMINQQELRSQNQCSCCCLLNCISILPIALPLCPFAFAYNCCATNKVMFSWYPTKEYPNNVCCCLFSE